MKKILVLILVAACGYLAFQFLTTGEVSLPGGAELSPSQKQLRKLEADLQKDRDAVDEAWTNEELSSVEASAMISGAIHDAERIQQELDALLPELTSDVDRARAAALEIEVRKFIKESR
jgi:hypothetical protein